MGHKQKRNRRIPSKGKQLPSYNQIQGWNIRNRNYIFELESVQWCQIQQGFYPWGANTLQPYREIPTHKSLFVSPTRRHKRLHQRRSFKASKNKFLWNHFWREHEEFFSTRLKNRDYPATTAEKHLSEVFFANRKKSLEQRHKNVRKKILPFHALCNEIPPCVAQPQEHTHLEMAPYTEPTIPEKHLKGASPRFISQRKIRKRHSSKNKTIKVLRPIYLRTAGVVQAGQHF